MPVHFPKVLAHGHQHLFLAARASGDVTRGGRVPTPLTILRDANTGAGQDHHRPGCGGSTPPSCRIRFSGLQTLIVKSRLLTGENSVQIRGDPPFRIRGEITIILRFERRVCRWESCRMHQFMPR